MFWILFRNIADRLKSVHIEVIFIRIAIVDDLEQDRTQIQHFVSDYLSDQNITAELCLFSSGEEFMQAYTPGRYSILFLDLYMGSTSGMDIAHSIRGQGDNCPLVFITATDSYAVESYGVNATYYLLKPVAKAPFEQAMHRCLSALNVAMKSIMIVANRIPTRIPLNSILWVDVNRNAVQLHTDGGIIKTYLTFEKFFELLENDRRFLLCYKGCIINMDRIVSVENDVFVVDNGDYVPIRKRGSNEVKRHYIQYLCERAATND